jgi:GntR family transcriptional regulator
MVVRMPVLARSPLDAVFSGGPLYRQLCEAIAEGIAEGRWGPGRWLPSERRLCEMFGVSRVTVRRALAALVEEGLLEPDPGRGWVVTAGSLGQPPNVLLSFTTMARERGLEPSAIVREHAVRAATMDEAEGLGVAPGAELVHLERIRLLEGLPVALDRSLVPLARCPALADADFSTASLYEVLREHGGLVPTFAETTVEAVGAGDDLARVLDLRRSWPVLVTTQTTFDQHERPLEASRIAYRGDRHRFRARLSVRL